MSPTATPTDPVRLAILSAIARAPKRTSLKKLSEELGRNHAYLHQFIHRGTPRILPEDTRLALAHRLGIHEETLRHTMPFEMAEAAPPPLQQAQSDAASPSSHEAFLTIHAIDHPSQGDHILPWSVPASLFPKPFSVNALKLVQLPSSSWNSSASSDMVIIDTSDLDAMRAGLFALDQGNHIRVRHLEQVSASAEDIIVSGLHDQQYQTLPSHLSILGRVVFQASLFLQSQSAAMA